MSGNMERSTIILVQPIQYDEDEDDWVGVTKDQAQMDRRWDEFKRLQVALTALGFDQSQHMETLSFSCEGCNWDAKMLGNRFDISPQNIMLLEGRADELAELRKTALAKLSPAEQYALGVLRQN